MTINHTPLHINEVANKTQCCQRLGFLSINFVSLAYAIRNIRILSRILWTSVFQDYLGIWGMSFVSGKGSSQLEYRYYSGLPLSVLWPWSPCTHAQSVLQQQEKMGRSAILAITFKLLAGFFTVLWGTVTVLRLIWEILRHPIRSFQRSKREVPPACLTDPALGRHEYITANGNLPAFNHHGCTQKALGDRGRAWGRG